MSSPTGILKLKNQKRAAEVVVATAERRVRWRRQPAGSAGQRTGIRASRRTGMHAGQCTGVCAASGGPRRAEDLE